MNKRKTLRMTSILLALMMFFGMMSVLLVPAGTAGAAATGVNVIPITSTSSSDTDNVIPKVVNDEYELEVLKGDIWDDGVAYESIRMNLIRPNGNVLTNYSQVNMTKNADGNFSTTYKVLAGHQTGMYTMELRRYYSNGTMDQTAVTVAAFYLADVVHTTSSDYRASIRSNPDLTDGYYIGNNGAKTTTAATAANEHFAAPEAVLTLGFRYMSTPTATSRAKVISNLSGNIKNYTAGNVPTTMDSFTYAIPSDAADGDELVIAALYLDGTNARTTCELVYFEQNPAVPNSGLGSNSALNPTSLVFAPTSLSYTITIDAKAPAVGDILITNSEYIGTILDGVMYKNKTNYDGNKVQPHYMIEVESATDSGSGIGTPLNANTGVYAQFVSAYNSSNIVGGSGVGNFRLSSNGTPYYYSDQTKYPNAIMSNPLINLNGTTFAALVDGQWKLQVVVTDQVGNQTVADYGTVKVYENYYAIDKIRVESQNVLEMYVGQTLTKEEISAYNVKVQTNPGTTAATFPNAWYWYANAADSNLFDYDPVAGTVTAKKAGEGKLIAGADPVWVAEKTGTSTNNIGTVASPVFPEVYGGAVGILAHVNTNSGTGNYLLVRITDAPTVTSLTLNNSTMTIDEGQTQKLTATAVPSAVAVTWETSDSSIATVASDGTVTGVKAGTAVIFAKAGHLTKSCVVTVKSTTIVDPDPPAEDLKGWVDENNNRYYYVDNQKVVGWRKIDGSWYFFDYTSAAMRANGWLKEGGKWYYLNSNGTMKSAEWFKDNNGKWYWLKANGAMAAGWEKINGTWYYFNASGAMQTGWVNVRGIWYYMKSSGAMAEGWLQDGGSWYYLTPGGGAMVTGRVTINGRASNFATSGRWLGYV